MNGMEGLDVEGKAEVVRRHGEMNSGSLEESTYVVSYALQYCVLNGG